MRLTEPRVEYKQLTVNLTNVGRYFVLRIHPFEESAIRERTVSQFSQPVSQSASTGGTSCEYGIHPSSPLDAGRVAG